MFEPGDLIKSKHSRLSSPCLVISTHTGGNNVIATIHDPEVGLRTIIIHDYTLLRHATDETRHEAETLVSEGVREPTPENPNLGLDPWEEYKIRCKRWDVCRLADSARCDAIAEPRRHLPHRQVKLGDLVGFRTMGCVYRVLKHRPTFNGIDGTTILQTDTALIVGGDGFWLQVLTRGGMGYLWVGWVKKL